MIDLIVYKECVTPTGFFLFFCLSDGLKPIAKLVSPLQGLIGDFVWLV